MSRVPSILVWAAIIGCFGVAITAAAELGPAFVDPAEAGPDFLIQGEYLGPLDIDGKQVDHGVQVIAQGEGKFQAVVYTGGLPGAGWDGGAKVYAEGQTVGDVTTFVTADSAVTAKIERSVVTVNATNGKPLGRLRRVERKSRTLGAKPPAGAVVLFDGTGTDKLVDARMTPDGLLMEPATSKQHFQSVRCHVEFRTPFMPLARGQARGNNGFFCQGRYQVQILDSFGLEGTKRECGAIYGVAAPRINMCLPPLSWQTFDVDFTAATFKDGKKVENARMTVHHNGVLVHDDVEFPGTSSGALINQEGPAPGPIFVQSHNAPLRFRNLWVVEKQ